MAREATCPVCNANIPLEQDDRPGDYVYCSYCGARLRVGAEKEPESTDRDKEVDVEEEWE
jgi:DNA-directed RNA polymerase subunit RPC12/RpoP